MIDVRTAQESDVEAIRDVFLATYGKDYSHPEYYDPQSVKKMVFDDETLLLVAEEQETGRVLGTASVLLQVGTNVDLVGEFGRLAVHPDARGKGVGRALMQGRLEHVGDRLHVGIVDNRAAHPFSQKISIGQRFMPVGFLPLRLLLARRESLSLHVRHFSDALSLRRNDPHVVPEAYRLADLALGNCGLPCDVIVDDQAAPYPDLAFRPGELTTEGYARLLRFERGRVRHREIFGPVRLHYGLFMIRAKRSNYLLAYDGDQLVGAVGTMHDATEKTVRIFELVSADEAPVRFLLASVEAKCREWGVEYVEVDVSADAPRMQRTLLELGYLPAAYVPAMVFHDVERLDVVRMVRLLVAPDPGTVELVPEARPVADAVMRQFATCHVMPTIAEALPRIPLLAGLTDEQRRRVGSMCRARTFEAGETLVEEGRNDGRTYLLLEGVADVLAGSPPRAVGQVEAGESVGEMSLLSSTPYSATARARTRVVAAELTHEDLQQLVRLRPDIAVAIYRNFAGDLGRKLRRATDEVRAARPRG